MTPRLRLGKDFGTAVCAFFGLPQNQVMANICMKTGHDEIFAVTLTIALTADDLRKISDEMERIACRA